MPPKRRAAAKKTSYVEEDLEIIRKGEGKRFVPILPAPPKAELIILPINPKFNPRPDHLESQKVLNSTSLQEAVQKGFQRCRLCLTFQPKVISIFKDDFPKMIELLTCLKVDRNDTRFPTVSCLQCASEVKNAMKVRKRILHSQKTLIEEFKNQILQCIIETEQAEQQAPKSPNKGSMQHKPLKEEPIEIKDEPINDPLEQNMISQTQLLNDEDVVYEVEVQTVCPNNTLGENIKGDNEQIIHLNSDEDNSSNAKTTNRRRTVFQTAKVLEQSNALLRRKQQAIGQNGAKRKNILASLTGLPANAAVKPPSIRGLIPSMRRKAIHPQMNLKIRERLLEIRKQTTEVFPKNEKIPCSVCQKLVLGKNMIKHIDCHSNVPIKCTLCNAICKNGNSLQSHIFYYHKCKADEFVCDMCGKAFRFKYKFMIHKKIHHGGEKDHQCQHCGKKFFTNVPLLRHIKAVHKKIKSHVCEYCGKGFQTKYGLRTHVRVHTLEAPYQCTFCDECFRQKVSLRNHLRVKHNMEENTTIFCETCGKGFSSDVALASHNRKLHEVQKCPHCSENFASAEFLNKHLKNAHGEDGEENEAVDGYESTGDDKHCPLCEKVFANYDVLNNHMQNVHGVSNMSLNDFL